MGKKWDYSRCRLIQCTLHHRHRVLHKPMGMRLNAAIARVLNRPAATLRLAKLRWVSGAIDCMTKFENDIFGSKFSIGKYSLCDVTHGRDKLERLRESAFSNLTCPKRADQSHTLNKSLKRLMERFLIIRNINRNLTNQLT